MRMIFAALMLFYAVPAMAAAPSVTAEAGEIVYVGADGTRMTLTSTGGYSDPVLSPDGRTIAFIHQDTPPDADGYGATTSLWIADVTSGDARKLIGPTERDSPETNFARFYGPVFSPEGDTIYVTADAWVTSGAVHAVSVATGEEHFVIDGGVNAVIRNGPLRGWLLVQRHKYHRAPEYGSYNPVDAVAVDKKATLQVPGSDKDDGEKSVAAWLKKKGYQAW